MRIKDEAVINAVELSHRYISDRYLPDKAIDLMDEAAAKIRIEIDSLPEELDELQRRIMQLEIEREAIRRENDKEKGSSTIKRDCRPYGKENELKAQWENEKAVIQSAMMKKRKLRSTD